VPGRQCVWPGHLYRQRGCRPYVLVVVVVVVVVLIVVVVVVK